MRGRAACLAARATRARAAAVLPADNAVTCWLPVGGVATTSTTTPAAAAVGSTLLTPAGLWTRGTPTTHARGFASSPASTSSSPSPSTSPPPPPVTLTPAAAARIRELVSRPAAVEAGHTALRLTVEAGGCSGFSYVFALDSGPKPGDAVVTGEGGGGGGDGHHPPPTLIIDPVSLDLVRGGTVDFVTELIKAGFEVTANPNADGGCGCGASFTPKF